MSNVKSIEQGTAYYTDQLRAQKEGALKGHPDGKQRDLAVVISNNNRTDVQPSKPLADSAKVLHRNAETGKWSLWDKRDLTGLIAQRLSAFRTRFDYALLTEAQLIEADFTEANLDGSHLASSNLGLASFNQASMREVCLQYALFSNGYCKNARLRVC
jgi:uncharacterized protein YjbI with pentapeptide repeats